MQDKAKEIPQIAKLKKADLRNMQLGDEGVKILVSCPTEHIDSMWLCGNRLSFQAAQLMTQAKWSSLTFLNLGLNYGEDQIGDLGCKYLSRIDFPSLLKLYLGSNQITSNGLIHLAKARWHNLKKIILYQNKVGQLGLKSILVADWPSLIGLDLENNLIHESELAYLLLVGRLAWGIDVTNNPCGLGATMNFLSKLEAVRGTG